MQEMERRKEHGEVGEKNDGFGKKKSSVFVLGNLCAIFLL
jgi:hypothetical protein